MFIRFILALCLVALETIVPAIADDTTTTTVYFVTNRAKGADIDSGATDSVKFEENFLKSFGADLVYGVAQVEIPDHKCDWQQTAGGKLKYLTDLRREEKRWLQSDVTGMCYPNADELKKIVAAHKKVLLFVHGYNMDVTNSVQVLGRVVSDLKRMYPEDAADLVPIAFCWPSERRWQRYVSDQERVQLSQTSFNKFMDEIGFGIRPNPDNQRTIAMFSHSLGNILTVNYLISRGQQLNAPDHQISRVLLCSPDISYYLYYMNEDTIQKNCDSISILFSGNDRPILVSRLLHNCPRLGSPFKQPSKFVAKLFPKQMDPLFYLQMKPVPDWMKGLAGNTQASSEPAEKVSAPATNFIDFTNLDVGMARVAIPFLTFQIGHGLPGPLLSSLFATKPLTPPHSWKYEIVPKKLEKSAYFDQQFDRILPTFRLNFLRQGKSK